MNRHSSLDTNKLAMCFLLIGCIKKPEQLPYKVRTYPVFVSIYNPFRLVYYILVSTFFIMMCYFVEIDLFESVSE